MSQLRKATRQKAKIRLGLSATSGSGKTYSSLLIAKGLCGDLSKVAVIDTENGSGDLYAHLGPYNVLPLAAPFSPEKYVEAIKTCESAGMEVIIIDSITHEWDGPGGILSISNSMSGNSYTNWAKLTPRHDAFIQAILQSPCHMITTVRRKQDYEMGKDSNGKATVTKVGLKEVTRDGWEYEVTANLELEPSHYATASKDRTGLFAGKPTFIPSEETGKLLRSWCDSGAEPLPAPVPVLDTVGDPREELTVTHEKWALVVDAIKTKGYKIASVEVKYRLSEEIKAMLSAIVPAVTAPPVVAGPGQVTTQETIHANNAAYVPPSVSAADPAPKSKRPF